MYGRASPVHPKLHLRTIYENPALLPRSAPLADINDGILHIVPYGLHTQIAGTNRDPSGEIAFSLIAIMFLDRPMSPIVIAGTHIGGRGMGIDIYRGGWQRSSRCGTTTCIEVTGDSQSIYIRDSKETNGSMLGFSHDTWRAFIQSIKDDPQQ